jgi:endonuclease YncB( thermonuclease family)
MALSGVAHLQDGWPAVVFYPFGHLTPYTYDQVQQENDLRAKEEKKKGFSSSKIRSEIRDGKNHRIGRK